MLTYKNLFHTGGRYYTYITKEELEHFSEEGFKYELNDLKVGEEYTFFRACKDPDKGIIYLRLSGVITELDDDRMIYRHHGPELKGMVLEGYKDHWFFIKGNVEDRIH